MNVNEIIVTIRDRAGGEINPDTTLPDEQLVLGIERLKDQLTALTESPDAGTAERGSLWMQLHTECDQLREQLDAARHGTEVTSVYICKLPYQEHPFVHGARDGHDVWLRSNGQWTDIEDAPDADIPLYGDISIVGKNENIEIEHLKSLLTDARHGTELAESEVAGRDQEIERLKSRNVCPEHDVPEVAARLASKCPECERGELALEVRFGDEEIGGSFRLSHQRLRPF